MAAEQELQQTERRLAQTGIRATACSWISSQANAHSALAASSDGSVNMLTSTLDSGGLRLDSSTYCSATVTSVSASRQASAGLLALADGSVRAFSTLDVLHSLDNGASRSIDVHSRGSIRCACFGAIGVSVGAADGCVVFHDLSSLGNTSTASLPSERASKIDCAMGGSHFLAVSAGASPGVQMWDCRISGERLRMQIPQAFEREVVTCVDVAKHDECIVAAGTSNGSAVLWDARKTDAPVSWCSRAVDRYAVSIKLDSSGRIGTAASGGAQPLPAVVASTSGQLSRVEWRYESSGSAVEALKEDSPMLAMDLNSRNGPHILYFTQAEDAVHVLSN